MLCRCSQRERMHHPQAIEIQQPLTHLARQLSLCQSLASSSASLWLTVGSGRLPHGNKPSAGSAGMASSYSSFYPNTLPSPFSLLPPSLPRSREIREAVERAGLWGQIAFGSTLTFIPSRPCKWGNLLLLSASWFLPLY